MLMKNEKRIVLKKGEVKKKANDYSGTSALDKLIHSIAKKAKRNNLTKKEQIEQLIKQEYGLNSVNRFLLEKILKEMSEKANFSLYDIKRNEQKQIEAVKIKEFNNIETTFLNACINIIREGKALSVRRIQDEMHNLGLNIKKGAVEELVEKMPEFKILSRTEYGGRGGEVININDRIVQLNEERLQKGLPPLIPKGRAPTVENAVRNLLKEGKKPTEIREILGVPKKTIDNILKKYRLE